MSKSRYYDTVAFDVRDNATMLFFAKTSSESDIEDYLLLLRTVDEEFDESVYIEVNEQQFGGHELLKSAALVGNTLTLRLHEPAAELGNSDEIVLTFAETADNLSALEAGLFRVLGDALEGGHA
ncbi:MAG: hypothetical protein V2I25_13240 [Woeseiaceae bacterium]|nr:hypothetical protein [Woeseiaceae bacterium]